MVQTITNIKTVLLALMAKNYVLCCRTYKIYSDQDTINTFFNDMINESECCHRVIQR